MDTGHQGTGHRQGGGRGGIVIEAEKVRERTEHGDRQVTDGDRRDELFLLRQRLQVIHGI